MLVEFFPQCPKCLGSRMVCRSSRPASDWQHVPPKYMNDGHEPCHPWKDCPGCDGLGVLIPDEMVEAVAMGAFEANDEHLRGEAKPYPWDEPSEYVRDNFRAMARAGLAALVRHQQEAK